jgi:hypothetical protein
VLSGSVVRVLASFANETRFPTLSGRTANDGGCHEF